MRRRGFILSGLLMATGPFLSRAYGATEPDTPAARQVKRYIEALLGPMNDDDVYKVIAEIEKTPSLSRDALPGFRSNIHGLQPYGIVRATATEAEYVARDPNLDAWIHFVVTVEPDPPHRILSLKAKPGDPPPAGSN